MTTLVPFVRQMIAEGRIDRTAFAPTLLRLQRAAGVHKFGGGPSELQLQMAELRRQTPGLTARERLLAATPLGQSILRDRRTVRRFADAPVVPPPFDAPAVSDPLRSEVIDTAKQLLADLQGQGLPADQVRQALTNWLIDKGVPPDQANQLFEEWTRGSAQPAAGTFSDRMRGRGGMTPARRAALLGATPAGRVAAKGGRR